MITLIIWCIDDYYDSLEDWDEADDFTGHITCYAYVWFLEHELLAYSLASLKTIYKRKQLSKYYLQLEYYLRYMKHYTTIKPEDMGYFCLFNPFTKAFYSGQGSWSDISQ